MLFSPSAISTPSNNDATISFALSADPAVIGLEDKAAYVAEPHKYATMLLGE